MCRLNILMILICSSLSYKNYAINGDGHVTSEKRLVTEFTHITINGPFEIVFSSNPNSDFFVKVECDKNLQEYITVSQQQADVWINLKPGSKINEFTKAMIYVDNRDIHSVTINSNNGKEARGEIRSCSNLNLNVSGRIPVNLSLFADKLIADINNQRTTTLNGRITESAIVNNGIGEMSAFGLVSDKVRVKNSGLSAMEIMGNEDIQIENSARSYIYYKGSGNLSKLKEAITGSSCREAGGISQIPVIDQQKEKSNPTTPSFNNDFNTDSLFASMIERDQKHRRIRIGDTMHTAADDSLNFVCLKWYLLKYGYPELHNDSLKGMIQTLFIHIDNYTHFEQIKLLLSKALKEKKITPNTYAYSCDRSMIADNKRPIYFYFFVGSDWDKRYKPTKDEIPEVNKQRKLIGLPNYPLLLNGKYF